MKLLIFIILSVSLLTTVYFELCCGYVNSGLPGHVHRAWLNKMTSDIMESPIGFLPPELCDATPQLLLAWAQNPFIPHSQQLNLQSDADVFPHHGKECAQTCELLLRRWVNEKKAGNLLEAPTTTAYNCILDVWRRSGEHVAAAQRMEEILIGMQDAYSVGQKEVQPDYKSFRSVILAWSQAGRLEESAAQRSTRVLEWMIKLYQSGENNLASPDTSLFNIVLHTWAISHHKDAPHKTEEILILMDKLSREGYQSVRPNCMSFNQVLTAWSKSCCPIAATRGQDILDYMEVLSLEEGNSHLRPNIVSYATVATAWARVGNEASAIRAESILNHVERAYVKGDKHLCPDTVLYNVVIEGHGKTNTTSSFVRARRVLDRQMALYKSGVSCCRPDVYGFTSAIGACASVSGSSKVRNSAFRIASKTFQEMCDFDNMGVAPNHVTYGMMMKACARLLPPGAKRDQLVKQYFSMCCQDGCVGEMVLSKLREAASPDLFKLLLNGASKSTLPPEWTWQVPQNERRDRRQRQSKKNRVMP